MSNLSKQIFELCGVEPRYIYDITFDYDIEDGVFKDARNTFIGKEHLLEWWINVDWAFNKKIFRVKRIHPDLETNANNFVKLQELKIDKNWTLMAEIGLCCAACNRQEFLECLVKILNKDSDKIEQLKQAIRQQEWEW